jgi:phospho-N-acetylmuramoyl-pentapeptide-transferase
MGERSDLVIALFVSAAISLLVALIATPLFIRWLRGRGFGQPIQEDGPQGHFTKAGTPTMGGLVIVGASVLGWLAGHLRAASAGHLRITAVFTTSGVVVEGTIIAAGLVGLVDDYLKVRHNRNLGLNKRTKFAGQFVVAVAFAVLAVTYAHVHTEISFLRLGDLGWHINRVEWVIFAILVIVGSCNAVNLTDGLDGLAAGSASFAFATLVIIGFWAFRHPTIYKIDHPLDLTLVAASLVGGCAGFLWWNAAPAAIFMGDVGSLAIGAGLAAMCLTMNLDLLLPIIGGLYVIETVSVMVQVASFRLFHRRVFRMAPIHHHFELKGWPETTVIVRFWILAAMCTALALGFFYADFIAIRGID